MAVLGFPSGSVAPKFPESQMLQCAFQLTGFMCAEATPRAAVAADKINMCISVAFALQIWWKNGVGVFVDLEANTAPSGTPTGVTPGFLF